MTVVPFLLIAAAAGTVSLLVRERRASSTLAAVGGLGAMTWAAASMGPTAAIEIGGVVLAGSEWLRLYALLGCVVGLLLVAVDVAAMHEPDVPGVIVLGLGAAVLALAIPDAGIAVVAATAGGLAGVLVAAPVGAAARAAFIGAREIRALAVAGALGIVAAAWLARPLGELAAAPGVLGLAYLAFGLAVAVRFGAIPFHLWAARVADAAPGVALPLLLAWGPAAFAAVALVWIDQAVAPLALPLGPERAVIAAIGAVGVVLGIIAAWIQDDLEHIVGYSIAADAGFVVLGLAALEPGVWEPTRTWLLAFVVGRSALAAWAVAVHGAFGTRRLPELDGWARRAPVLALGLVVVAAASIGWPGFVAWEARATIAGLALPGPVAGILAAAPLGLLAVYGRMLMVGTRVPGPMVRAGRGDRPRRPVALGAVHPRSGDSGALGAAGAGDAVAADELPIALRGPLVRASRTTVADAGVRLRAGAALVLPAGRENRVPLASIAVLALAGLAFAVSGGGLGVPEAARAVPAFGQPGPVDAPDGPDGPGSESAPPGGEVTPPAASSQP